MIDVTLVFVLLLAVGGFLYVERQRGQAAEAAGGLATLLDAPGQAQPGYYWRLARQSGLPPDSVWPVYIGSKIALALVVPLALFDVASAGPVRVLLAAALGFFIPDLIMAWVRRERQMRVRVGVSFFLDMLVSLLQAGLSLEDAFRRVAKEALPKGHPLAEEALQVVEEMELGRDRSAGFQALADRTGVVELRAVASALGLGVTLGSSVEATLRAQADLARAKRREEAMRRLNVASAEVLLPLLLCGFPLFVVLVFFPLALQFMSALQGLSGILR